MWVVLAIALVSLRTLLHAGPILGYDSFQYLSVAENLSSGNGIRTSIAHFDQEHSHGELPAPMTWFPAGYPALITLVGWTGIPPLWAGFLLSGTAFCALVPVTVWLCSWYGFSVVAARLVLLCLISNSTALTFGVAVLSESVFTTLCFGALVLLLIASSPHETARPVQTLAPWALCGLTIGLACWVRYAGLFLFGGVGLFLVLEVLRGRHRDLRGPLLTLGAAAAPIAVLLLRNEYLVGTWKGGNTRPMSESAFYVGKRSVAAVYQLILGPLQIDRLGLSELLLGLAGITYGFLAVRAAWQHREAIARALSSRPTVLPLLTFLGVYTAAMVYLTFFSINHVSSRYCYPLLPPMLVLIGLLVTLLIPHAGPSRTHPVALAALVVVVAGYLFLNMRDTLQPRLTRSSFIERKIAEFFEKPTASGEPLRSWVEANIPTGANIVATDGQPTAYVLRRKTVSLPSLDYTGQEWGEQRLSELMSRFDAEFLILYLGSPTLTVPAEQSESHFLMGLARGAAKRDWLQLATQNPHIMIFRRIAQGVGEVPAW